MFTRAIVRPPSRNFAEGLTTVDLGRPDYASALEQHHAYCAALEQAGLTLIHLEADDRYPDATFVEDTALLTSNGAVLSRPGAMTRQGEVAAIAETLTKFFSKLASIREPGTLDAGDVCDAGEHFFIGISERTNTAGADQLAQLLKSFGYTSTFVDIRGVPNILHLKSGIASLDHKRLVIIDELSERPEFAEYELITIPAGDEYAANCVQVNDYVLVAAGFGQTEKQLRVLGYQTLAIDMSEYQKMDGGLSCLSLRF